MSHAIDKDRLRQLRKKRKVTVEEITKFVQCQSSTYYGWENGYRQPGLTYFKRLVEILETNSDFLQGFTDDDSPNTGKNAERIDVINLFSRKDLRFESAGKELTQEQINQLERAISSYVYAMMEDAK